MSSRIVLRVCSRCRHRYVCTESHSAQPEPLCAACAEAERREYKGATEQSQQKEETK